MQDVWSVLKTQIPKVRELQEEIAIIKLSQYPRDYELQTPFESTILTYGSIIQNT